MKIKTIAKLCSYFIQSPKFPLKTCFMGLSLIYFPQIVDLVVRIVFHDFIQR